MLPPLNAATKYFEEQAMYAKTHNRFFVLGDSV
jgi:hypothetical protein